MRMSFNARLSWQTSLVLAATMLVVFAYTWVRAQDVVGDLSGRVVAQTSEQAIHRVNSFLDTTEQQARMLAGLASPANTIDAQHLDSADFNVIGPQMVEMLNAVQDLSSITIVLKESGEYVRAVRRSGGAIVLNQATLDADQAWSQTTFTRYGGTLQRGEISRTPPPDLRREESYLDATAAKSLVWTNARMLSREGETDAPGVTCAVPIFDGSNETIGVAQVDLTLTNLSRYVARINFSGSGKAFLVELRQNGEPRIIAHPDPSRLLVAEGGRFRLATAVELDDSAVTQLLNHIRQQGTTGTATSGRVSLTVNGRPNLAGFQLLAAEGRPRWILGIVVPSEVFMGDLRADKNVLILVAIIALLAGIYASLLLAQNIAKPVESIVTETARIRRMDFAPRPLEHSNIEELDQLANAMEALKSSLRSFGKLVPSQYARHLLETGQEAKLGGERKHVTIYFADIVGFTRLSEMMPPENLVDVLTEYLDVLSSKVIEHEGTVDKFNGDDVMAFWGAPNPVDNPALKACVAALRSKQAIHDMHQEWQSRGMPLLLASFGISTGDVVVGNVGSRERMNYTVIGDAVNLASRLQGLNKFYETEILIGEHTRHEAGGAVVTRLLDFVAVSGRERPAPVYELVGLAGETSEGDLRIAALHNEAMEHYRGRRFVEASDVFRTIIAMRENDGPARIMLKRCAGYIKQAPGDDWDGSYRVDTK